MGLDNITVSIDALYCGKVNEKTFMELKNNVITLFVKGETNLSSYYGEALYVDKGVYKHFGVGVGEEQVIHFNGRDKSNARIILSSIKEFSGGRTINLCIGTTDFTKSEIVGRAYSKLGRDFGGYDLVNNNCEHFARWCVFGKKSSSQVFIKNDEQDVVEKAIDHFFDSTYNLVGKPIDDLIDGIKKLFS
ncbi:lecithin retinol acyltransferase family protein [Peribacillus asahii]|uniref:lecithin retinol acyltransferase family protein n=1 Tax=Peribacillus asahii TaxID=228899 RepID=UPI002079D9AB|nr:lecithin retinol acyltransferase family protein [Peribacillus asahii]USK71256.1 lecithin retinol acyltransferase family protein [Peribacillus asahii]